MMCVNGDKDVNELHNRLEAFHSQGLSHTPAKDLPLKFPGSNE